MTQAVKDASLPRPSGIKKKKGSTSEPKSTKDSLTMNGLTEEKVAAAAASTRIPDQKGADNIFDDVEVVYCKLRGDDCSTVAGDYSDEDSLSSVGSSSDDADDMCSILGEKNDVTEDF